MVMASFFHVYQYLVIEQMKQQKRQLNRVQREMTRDKGALERQEKQLVCVISLHHTSLKRLSRSCMVFFEVSNKSGRRFI